MNKVKTYLKNKKILLLSLLLILFIGVSFAYVIAQISGGATGNVNISADTTDNLKFSVDKEINLNPTQFSVTEGGSGLSDQATGTASLVANSTNKTATFNYYVYFRINSNNYVYTTPEKTPEIVLTITNPLGEEITSLSGLNYVTTTNADGTQVKGFDITTADGLYNVASLYEISSRSSINPTIQNWTFKVTFINLETNQHENGGKSLNAEIILSREIVKNYDVVMTAYSNGISFNHSTPANYTVTTDCSVGSAEWNYKTWGLDIDFSGVGKAKCNANYTEKEEKTYLNDYIISLSGQTQGTGQVVNENGYRYEGKNPNNYIWFNNELWRIIGVFDEDSHGVSGENLVKIIREESIGGLVWDKSGTNDWSASNLKSLLNGAYYDWDSNKSSVSTYCYGYRDIPGNCDYSEIGINDTYRSMIQNVTWYLRGYSRAGETAESFYNYERTTGTVYSGRPTETTGYIGLMYPSDYGYSVLASSCARTTNLSSYNKSTCVGQSWLYKTGYEWTITPSSSRSSYVFSLHTNGLLDYVNANHGYSIRPVLYLSSSVYKITGDGTISNPYIIGM